VTNGLHKDPDDDYFDIYWMDGAGQKHLDRFSQLKNHQRINHLPGTSIICRKNELGKLLNFMRDKYPKEFQFYPKTWNLPRDLKKFEEHVEQQKEETFKLALLTNTQNNYQDPIYIVKPEAACQGKGIFLIKEHKDIENNYNSGYSRSD
jgi:tubulin polyglutamylase TTLL6/13